MLRDNIPPPFTGPSALHSTAETERPGDEPICYLITGTSVHLRLSAVSVQFCIKMPNSVSSFMSVAEPELLKYQEIASLVLIEFNIKYFPPPLRRLKFLLILTATRARSSAERERL